MSKTQTEKCPPILKPVIVICRRQSGEDHSPQSGKHHLGALKRSINYCLIANLRQHVADDSYTMYMQAFARMEYDPGAQLLQAIADDLAKKSMDCNPQNVANSVWAFGVLGTNINLHDLAKHPC